MNEADIKFIITKAWRNAKRNKGVKQKQGIVRRLATLGKHGAHRVDLEMKPGLNTACWSIGSTGSMAFSTAFHDIKVGLDFAQPLPGRLQEDQKELLAFACSLIRHEANHGEHTEILPREMSRRLREKKIPFDIWNLFEDARIEHLERERTKDGNSYKRFRWWRWTPCIMTESPRNLFWNLINREASSYSSPSVGQPRFLGSERVKKRVQYFYRAACNMPTTALLLPLLEAWVKEFPAPVSEGQDLRGFSPWLGGELCPAAESEGIGTEEEDETEKPAVDPEQIKEDNERRNEQIKAELRTWWRLFPGSNERVNWGVVDQLTGKLGRLVTRAAHAPQQASMTGSRLHIPNAISGSAAAFRRQIKVDGRKALTFIVDTSGSMDGDPFKAAKELLIALARLDRKGVIDVRIWLSGSSCRAKLDTSIPDGILAGLCSEGGGEGLDETLSSTECRHDLDQSRCCIIYTDGNLGHAELQTNRLRGQGVDVVGAYVGSPSGVLDECMSMHFGRYFSDRCAFDLATSLIKYIVR